MLAEHQHSSLFFLTVDTMLLLPHLPHHDGLYYSFLNYEPKINYLKKTNKRQQQKTYLSLFLSGICQATRKVIQHTHLFAES